MSARKSKLFAAAVFALPLWISNAQATPFAYDLVAQTGTGIDGEDVFLSQNDFVALNESNDVFFQGLTLFSTPDPLPTLRVAKLFLRKSGSISTLLRTDTTPGAPPPTNMQIVGMGERNAFTEPTVFFSTIANGSFDQVFRLNSAIPFDVANDTITTQNSSRFAVSDTGFVVRKDQDSFGGITRTKCQQDVGNPCNPIDPPTDMSPGISFNAPRQPSVNAVGQTAFTGRPDPFDLDLGIIVSQSTGGPATVNVLVNQDDAPLGFPPGSTFTSFSEPDINDTGKIAFVASVRTNTGEDTHALYTINTDGTGLTRIASDSDLETPNDFLTGVVKINNANEVAFSSLDKTTFEGGALHMTVGGAPRAVAKAGDVIDGIATTQLSITRFDFNDQGKLAFYGGPSTFDTGLFVASFDDSGSGGGPNITQVAQLVTGSDAVLSQILNQTELDATSGALDLSFDYRFLTPDGALDISIVLLDDLGNEIGATLLGSLGPAGDLFLTETLTITEALADDMRAAEDVKLLFTLSEGLSGAPATLQLDNIFIAGLENGDFETGDLTNWLDESEGNATVSNEQVTLTTVPEPASVALFTIGLFGLGWLRRRRETLST